MLDAVWRFLYMRVPLVFADNMKFVMYVVCSHTRRVDALYCNSCRDIMRAQPFQNYLLVYFCNWTFHRLQTEGIHHTSSALLVWVQQKSVRMLQLNHKIIQTNMSVIHVWMKWYFALFPTDELLFTRRSLQGLYIVFWSRSLGTFCTAHWIRRLQLNMRERICIDYNLIIDFKITLYICS
jgi:hypothetical protein